jgi:pimeloyl-ACP methyl ester carboxylesterase
MCFVTNPTDHTRIAYEVLGSGPPLMLFHGSLTSSVVWHAAGYVEALADDYQLILLDARGHGRSDTPHVAAAYTLERFVEDSVAVLDTLGIERAMFWGYSLGARVAFGIGRYAPERFAALVIGGGTYITRPGTFDRLAFPGALDTLATLGIPAFLDAWEEYLGSPVPASVRASMIALDDDALVAYLRSLEQRDDLTDAFPRMRMPVLLYAGEHDRDRLVPSLQAAEQLPDATFLTLAGANHLSAFDRRDAIRPYVTMFLQQVSGVLKAA